MKRRSTAFLGLSLVLAAVALVSMAAGAFAFDPLLEVRIDYQVGDRSRSVFSADLDGNNENDLAVANAGSDNV